MRAGVLTVRFVSVKGRRAQSAEGEAHGAGSRRAPLRGAPWGQHQVVLTMLTRRLPSLVSRLLPEVSCIAPWLTLVSSPSGG